MHMQFLTKGLTTKREIIGKKKTLYVNENEKREKY
jgi:hypothetical protein